MNKILLILTPSLFLLLQNDLHGQDLIRGPYLQTVTTESIYIKWRTDSPTDSKVWWGTDPGDLFNTIESEDNTTEHEIQITGLLENSTYYYAIGDSNGELAGGDADHYFRTSPPSNTDQTIRAWVLGNAGQTESPHHDFQRAVRDAFYNYIGSEHIDLMLLLGDNAYDDGTDDEYQEAIFEDKYEDRLINSVMWSCYGNRDAKSADAETETGPYFDIFTFPKNGEAGGTPSGTEAYYSFDYGNIHFISLNSHDGDHDPGGPMLNWLVDDLNNTTLEWKVVMFHFPPYNGTNNNGSDGHPNETSMRENVVPILEAAGVDLVLSAHHHSYQRSYLLNGHYDVSATWDDAMALDLGDGRLDGIGAYRKGMDEPGTVYMVTGSAARQATDPSGYPAMFTSARVRGSVALEVTGLQMDVKFINLNGVIDDYFTMIKTPAGAPSVEITSPMDKCYIFAPQQITINADASDDGLVSKVEFYVDDDFIGIAHNAPYSVNWTIPSDGIYQITAVATDNDNLSASHTISIQVGAVTVNRKINTGIDDAEELVSSGVVDITNGDLELIMDGDDDQIVGLRFTFLNIPQGAVIDSAYIQFTCNEAKNSNSFNVYISAHAIDDAPKLLNHDFNISSRPKTNASVHWPQMPNWTTPGESGPNQRTPDLSSVLQEIVDRPGFSQNSDVVFIFEGEGRRTAYSYDGGPYGSAVLTVSYKMSAPLPVQLSEFNARVVDEGVKLNWTTASEINNDFFSVERSLDGRAFQSIGIVYGMGTSTESNHYYLLDDRPENGLSYYRLKQVDFDENFSYSNIVSANIEKGNTFSIYPTIVENNLTIYRSGKFKEKSTLILHDLTGKNFESLVIAEDENEKVWAMDDLAPGIYFISIYGKEKVETFKFFKP